MLGMRRVAVAAPETCTVAEPASYMGTPPGTTPGRGSVVATPVGSGPVVGAELATGGGVAVASSPPNTGSDRRNEHADIATRRNGTASTRSGGARRRTRTTAPRSARVAARARVGARA